MNGHINRHDGLNKGRKGVGTVLLIWGCLLFASCKSTKQESHCILPDDIVLQEGDVVFRMGSGIESHAVRLMDSGGDYSHVGIVVDTMGCMMVVHAVPGEPDYEGDVDRVKLDEVQTFFSSVHAGRGSVMRASDDQVARCAARVALDIYRRGVLFDGDYDSADTTRMYCTELVMYAYHRAGLTLVTTKPHEVDLPMLHAKAYYPSDVYRSGHLKSVVKF